MEDTKLTNRWEPIDFTVYFKFTWLIALMAIIVEIIFRINADRLGSGMLFEQKEVFSWIIRSVFFVLIGWRVFKVFGGGVMIAVVSGAIAGLLIGLVISLFRFFGGFEVWKLFNVFTETLSAIVIGTAFSMLSSFIIIKTKK